MFTLGFIGFGEAAFNIAEGLKDEGFETIYAYDKFWNVEPGSELIRGRAEKVEVELVPGIQELIEKSEMIISAVSADMAVELARAAVPFLKQDKIYVDINATSPMTKEEIDSIVSPVALFVDCAVMGPVPPNKHKVPLSVSGLGLKEYFKGVPPEDFHDIFSALDQSGTTA